MQRRRGGRSARRTPVLVTLLCVPALLLAACTDEPPGEEGDGGVEEAPATGADLASKPELVTVLPDDRGDPPSSLRVQDLVEGDGPAASSGDLLTVHFVSASWASGQEFDATWDRQQPYTFTLGVGEVIPGWEQGLVGMRVGGRRSLVVPPELAYGDRGTATGIAPGETVVFVVDLLEIARE